jgi:hypothetical protein
MYASNAIMASFIRVFNAFWTRSMLPKPVLINQSKFIAFNYILQSVTDFKKSLKLVFFLYFFKSKGKISSPFRIFKKYNISTLNWLFIRILSDEKFIFNENRILKTCLSFVFKLIAVVRLWLPFKTYV